MLGGRLWVRTRLWERGESRGGRRPWAELGCPLWPSLLLSRERERRGSKTAYQQRIQPCNENQQSPLMQQVNSAAPAFSLSRLTATAPSRREPFCGFSGVGIARVIFSFAAGRAVSRIRWILERRMLFRASGHGAGAFNIACRFAFGNSPLGSRSCTMPLYPGRGLRGPFHPP